MSGVDVLGNVIPALLLVIGAPLGIWWWTRRARGGSTSRLRITEKAALGRNTWIAVAEIDGQRFLLGAAEHGVGLLSELEPAVVAETNEIAVPERTAADAKDRIEAPGMGLIRRLQQMTLRSPARPPRPSDATLR